VKLSNLIHEHVSNKQAAGMCYTTPSVRLKAFLKHVGDMDIRHVTAEQVRSFLDGGGGPVTTIWFCKYQALRSLFRYAIDRNYVKRSPLPKVLPKRPERMVPYIYAVEEVKRLIDAADSRHADDWLLDPHTARMLILLLYGTGLRIGEATRLKLSDVDFDEQIITVRETKFFKSRLVPYNDDLGKVLRGYHAQQWESWRQTDESTFLSCRNREPIKHQTARLVFYRMRAEAEVWREPTARYQPRLHDFRHTFAVTRLVSWYRDGKNVQRLLPHLSTYLGHSRLRDTQVYLKMTNELMAEASDCFKRYAFPEDSR
jgi:site-specific recombinase XerD